MGANDADFDATPSRRRFITRRHVEDAAEAGEPIRLRPRDVVTDEAAQRASDLHVRIERADRKGLAVPAGTSVPVASEQLRAAVRSAVIAELGHEPHGLDAAIDKVLDARGRP